MDVSDLDGATRTGTVAAIHDATAARHPDGVAVEYSGETISHAELRDASARFAGGLFELGLAPDDVLLVYLPNSPAYLIAALGAFKAGIAFSPANPMYRRRELAYQLADTDAAAILTHADLRETVAAALDGTDLEPRVITVGEAIPEGDVRFDTVDGDPTMIGRTDEDVALLPYTSGTTGRPKGVRLTHRNLRAQTFTALSMPDEGVAGEDVRSLIWLPLYHITGFVHTAWQPLTRGGTLYLRSPANWDAEDAMALVAQEQITHFVGVTAMYVDMVNTDAAGAYDLTSLVRTSEGGAKMSVAVQREFEGMAGVEIDEGYGLTETTGATHSQQGSTYGLEHGTIGQPLRITDCKIVDETGEEVPAGEAGELLVRGPEVMAGYHGMPEATDEAFTDAGYFRTGDIARRDGNNYYEIVDRKKHVIVSAGYNVYPSEVEELLAEHPMVAEAAVVGVPDDRRNEVPKAYVVTRPNVEPGVDVTQKEVIDHCLDAIAPYKHPRTVAFIHELPRTASGKVRKFELGG